MITLVQSVTVTGNGATSHPVTFAGAQTAGNCNVIASIAYSDFGSADPGPVVTAVVDSAGNGHASGPAYQIPSGGSGEDTTVGAGWGVAYAWNIKASAAGANTVTITTSVDDDSQGYDQYTICEFSGVGAASDPIVGAASASNDTGSTTVPTVVISATAPSGSLAVTISSGDVGASNAPAVNGVTGTLINNVGGSGSASGYGLTSGSGPVTVTFPSDPDDQWNMVAIVLAPPAAPTVTTSVIFNAMNE